MIPKAENVIRMEPKIDFNSRKVMEEIIRKLDPNSPTKLTAKVIEVFESRRRGSIPADELCSRHRQAEAWGGSLLRIVGEQAQKETDFDLSIEVRRAEDAPMSDQFQDIWALTTAQPSL